MGTQFSENIYNVWCQGRQAYRFHHGLCRLSKSKNVEVPEWASYVKTGAFKELGPQEDDWYFTRMAAVARQVFVRGATGVGMFKRIYGGTLKRGSRPTHNTTGSGAIARSCLNNLEKLGYLERD